MATVTELITRFSFAGDTGPLNSFNAGLNKAIVGIGAMAAASAAAGGALFAFVSSTTANLDPMVQLSRETGVALERIQELNFSASQLGSTSGALQGSLQGLSQRVGEAANGAGEGLKIFEQFNIRLRDNEGQVRNVDDVLTDLRRNMGGVADAEKINIANKLGLDKSLVQLLGQTDEQMAGLAARARELGIVTQEQGDAAAAFNDSLTVLGYGMDAIKNSIAVGFAPQLQDLVERFTDFLVANRELFERGLTLVADGIMALIDAFIRLAPVLAIGLAAFIAIKIAAIGFTGVMAALTSPILLVVAGIAAALLVIDDLIVAFQGGESVIRSFFQYLFGVDITPILQGFVAAVLDFVGGVIDAFEKAGGAIMSLFDGIFALLSGDFGGFVDGIAGFWFGMFDALTTGFGAVIGYFGDLVLLAFPNIVANIKGFFADVFSWITDKIDGIINAFKKVGDFIGLGDDDESQQISGNNAGGMGLIPGFSTNSQSSNTISQDIKIDVSSNDPQAAGRAVRDQLQEQLRDTQTQFNRGGR